MTMKNRLKENILEYGILFFKGKNFIHTHVNNSYHTFKNEIKIFASISPTIYLFEKVEHHPKVVKARKITKK